MEVWRLSPTRRSWIVKRIQGSPWSCGLVRFIRDEVEKRECCPRWLVFNEAERETLTTMAEMLVGRDTLRNQDDLISILLTHYLPGNRVQIDIIASNPAEDPREEGVKRIFAIRLPPRLMTDKEKEKLSAS